MRQMRISSIQGLTDDPLSVILTEKGVVMHINRKDDPPLALNMKNTFMSKKLVITTNLAQADAEGEKSTQLMVMNQRIVQGGPEEKQGENHLESKSSAEDNLAA